MESAILALGPAPAVLGTVGKGKKGIAVLRSRLLETKIQRSFASWQQLVIKLQCFELGKYRAGSGRVFVEAKSRTLLKFARKSMELQRDRHCERPLSRWTAPVTSSLATNPDRYKFFSGFVMMFPGTYLCYVLFLAKKAHVPLLRRPAMYWYVPSWLSAPQAMTFSPLIWSPDNRSITTQEH